MKQTLQWTYRVLRTVVVTVLVMATLVFAGLYVALLTPQVQKRVKRAAEQALSEQLHTDVTIGDVRVKPFNQVVLHHVAVPDQNGDSLLTVGTLAAGVDLATLLTERRVLLTYGEIIDLDAHITRPDKDGPTNAQFIIDALAPQPGKPPRPFDVAVRGVVLRRSRLRYDVLDQPRKQTGRFDVNHIDVSDLRADIALPRLRNNDFSVKVKRLSFAEQSGLELKNLAVNATITDTLLRVQGLCVELPHSSVAPADMELRYTALNRLGSELRTKPLTLSLDRATVTPADLKALAPTLASLDEPITVTATVLTTGAFDEVHLPKLLISDQREAVSLEASGHADGLRTPGDLRVSLPALKVRANADAVSRIMALVPSLSHQARGIITRCGDVAVDGGVSADRDRLQMKGSVATSLGTLNIDGSLIYERTRHFAGHLATAGLRLGDLIGRRDLLGEVAIDADADLHIAGREMCGTVDGRIDHIDLAGRRLHNVVANVTADNDDIEGRVSVNDPTGVLDITGKAHLAGADTRIQATAVVNDFMPAQWGVLKNYAAGRLSLCADADFAGNTLSNADGTLAVTNLRLDDGNTQILNLEHVEITAANSATPQHIELSSDILNGSVNGQYDLATLVPAVKSMLGQAFPQYFSTEQHRSGQQADLTFAFTLEPSEQLQRLAHLPVQLLHTTVLDGHIDEPGGSMAVNLSAPYLLQGNKIIEGSSLTAALDSATHTATLRASTLIPSKNGKISVNLEAAGASDRLDANLGWRVAREQDFHGDLNLSALLQRTPAGRLDATVDINPTQLVFNDTVWQVEAGRVHVADGAIAVDGLNGHSGQQSVSLSGTASHDPADVLRLVLSGVSLDYVFDTLNIPNVDFGGRATGEFFASDLFNGAPRLSTPGLHIDAISYNDAVMGDADITSSWLNDERAVALHATINQHGGTQSIIDGAIFVADDSLHLTFDADHANIAFMRPFMAAFTSDVQGRVSGHAVLAGNFSTINLAGDIVADTLAFKLDYTGVTYTCSGEPVHIVPDYIRFADVRIHDRDGHEARLDGWLRHRAFHEPAFEFAITQARDLLCYDTDATANPVWHGTIYGNGSARVTGVPGQVDIKVNMITAPRSTFTFVLSDAAEAGDYTFVTFRDRDHRDAPAAATDDDSIPERVRALAVKAQHQDDQPTHYTIDLQGDITPDAQLTLVMDPAGGDRVRATGHGSMRMTYNDADEMNVYGTYTLERGNYNFTLQDIIIKDFTIRDGSSITFQGDPYAATMDIEAVYALNANLRDLDESFAQDKEITRTNVPVHALLRARGPMSQPDIAFDLEFPTLQTDAHRKVKSIISTDEMMNRQIIYLLALNRFYTPDYMAAAQTNRSSEWSSVASSTISSQLTSMLGKMSDNWSIAPNFRSARGDFSDVEVDVALSSQLLNNRLLLNGNFGYRDNTYSNQGSNFIGDFDLEYLLTRRGTLRLKAYNHFNDQNYYVRNALTTQGVGVVWKHDFDRPFDFLHRRTQSHPATADSTASPPAAAPVPQDTVPRTEP